MEHIFSQVACMRACVSCQSPIMSEHWVPSLTAPLIKGFSTFLLPISLSKQMMPEIFILFFFNGIPMASAANQVEILAYQVGEKLNVNHVLMWLRVTGTLFLLIIHQLEGSNKAEEEPAVFVLFLAAFPPRKKMPSRCSSTTLQAIKSICIVTDQKLKIWISICGWYV